MKKENKGEKKETNTNTTSNTTQNKDGQVQENLNKEKAKLAVFEEDDFFEEFDDEEYNEGAVKESEIDFKQWQEDWEDEEINDQFDKILKREMEAFKAGGSR